MRQSMRKKLLSGLFIGVLTVGAMAPKPSHAQSLDLSAMISLINSYTSIYSQITNVITSINTTIQTFADTMLMDFNNLLSTYTTITNLSDLNIDDFTNLDLTSLNLSSLDLGALGTIDISGVTLTGVSFDAIDFSSVIDGITNVATDIASIDTVMPDLGLYATAADIPGAVSVGTIDGIDYVDIGGLQLSTTNNCWDDGTGTGTMICEDVSVVSGSVVVRADTALNSTFLSIYTGDVTSDKLTKYNGGTKYNTAGDITMEDLITGASTATTAGNVLYWEAMQSLINP